MLSGSSDADGVEVGHGRWYLMFLNDSNRTLGNLTDNTYMLSEKSWRISNNTGLTEKNQKHAFFLFCKIISSFSNFSGKGAIAEITSSVTG